jgi:hypothetical protein
MSSLSESLRWLLENKSVDPYFADNSVVNGARPRDT